MSNITFDQGRSLGSERCSGRSERMISTVIEDNEVQDRSTDVWAYISPSRLNTWLRCPLETSPASNTRMAMNRAKVWVPVDKMPRNTPRNKSRRKVRLMISSGFRCENVSCVQDAGPTAKVAPSPIREWLFRWKNRVGEIRVYRVSHLSGQFNLARQRAMYCRLIPANGWISSAFSKLGIASVHLPR